MSGATYQKGIAAVKWTKTIIALTGGSDTLIGINPNRVGLVIVNPANGAQLDVDFAGGTVAANTGYPMAVSDKFHVLGMGTPGNAVTGCGGNGSTVIVWEGT